MGSWEAWPQRRAWWIVGGITAVALLLRLFRLGRWSFWIDEILTLQDSLALTAHWQADPIFALTNHPLTALVVNGTVSLWGESEWSARLGVAVLGATMPLLLFPLMRPLFGTAVTLLTLIFLALSPWHLYWSQNVRFYILLQLLFTVALLLFYRGLERDSTTALLGSLLLAGLASTERLLAVFYGPIILLYLLFLWWRPADRPAGFHRRHIGLLLGITAVLFIPAAWIFLRDPTIWQALYLDYRGAGPLPTLWQFARGIDPQIALLVGIGVGLAFYQRRVPRQQLFLWLAAGVPVIGVTVAALFQFTNGRYLFLCLPFWLLLAAQAAVRLAGKRGSPRLTAVFLTVLLLLPVPELIEYYTVLNGSRPDWRGAFLYVSDRAAASDLLYSNDPVVGAYYTERDYTAVRDRRPELLMPQLCQLDQPAWIVIGGNSRIHPQVRQTIETIAQPINQGFNNVVIYRLQPSTIPSFNDFC